VPVFVQGVDFLRGFADRCHHHKEEQLLFPALAEKGVPTEGGPIAVMLHEHDQGRAHIRAMGAALERYQAGDRKAVQDLAAAATGYTQLLRAHIWKEDNVLFQMANQALSAEEQQALAAEFDRVELEVMGAGTHERYHQMLDSLPAA
jgi:hemerythrin-like domain-containing protein